MSDYDNSVAESTRQLLEAIRESEVCRRFEAAKRRIEGCEQEKHMIDAFREKAYLLSNNINASEMTDEMDRLAEERQEIRKNPLIAEYLTSEMEYCRMLQAICMEVISAADLQIDDFIDNIEI